jgi:hypothetical protein
MLLLNNTRHASPGLTCYAHPGGLLIYCPPGKTYLQKTPPCVVENMVKNEEKTHYSGSAVG